jgi:ferredoxin-NADP reductase
VDPRHPAAVDRHAGLLGDERLPQLRRPLAGAAVLGRLNWQLAEVVDVVPETPRARTIAFDVPEWPGHRAGQHVDVRLTADDGYQAQRSYSIASAPDGTRVDLTVERLDDGEVSPYLTDVLRPGDRIELRGPVGGYFVWEPADGGPLLLVAGGSGVVPLMAMIRTRARSMSDAETRLLFSSRTWDDVLYRDELERLAGDGLSVVHTLTRAQPPGWTGYARRVDEDMLREVGPPPAAQPRVYVCGPTPFVEAVAEALVRLGHDPLRVKTERFGATGG